MGLPRSAMFAIAVLIAAAAFLLRNRNELSAALILGAGYNSSKCRCFPGDSCWPSDAECNMFNQTLKGKLIATVPIASKCHDSQFAQYDAEACEQLRSVWDYPETHLVTSSSPMAPFYANMSCDPYTPHEAQCVIGTYVRYAVNATSDKDYQSTLDFVQKHNIRLVIRNTGHDYLSKSTGAGALALWTHHLQDISIFDYSSPQYNGKAMRMGAGVLNGQAQAAAHDQGLIVIGGVAPSIGVAGGYTQGGGHGTLSSTYGLGADQVLEWEVITSGGQRLIATPEENSDLYWALSGGGGGTYAAVLSMTVKTYPDGLFAAARLTFTSQDATDQAFWSVVHTFLLAQLKTTDAGVGGIWIIADGFFSLQPLIGPGMTSKQLQAHLQTVIDALDHNNMVYDYAIDDFPTYLEADQAMSPQWNISQFNIGGRFLPRSLFLTDESTTSVTDALRFIAKNGGVYSGMSVNVARAPFAPNSVHPLWRSTQVVSVFGTPYDRFNYEANVAGQRHVTHVLAPALEALTPGGGAYLNEAGLHQPDFQEALYGNNYAKLKGIKEKYDPRDMFYGPTAVGSENWEIESDGRLCRTKTRVNTP
ncbi:hypothetical protein F5X99DRAFT_428134 [Biscogniauxia marginata]|nr:hypothetical protein F5X99DRAFT_428134 [Biscogniauxia marginata]